MIEVVISSGKDYKKSLDKKIKDFTKEEKRIYNNLMKKDSRFRLGKN